MTQSIPPWLAAMRAITGMTETPGSADNPHIMMMADYVARKYPHQAAYAECYTGDDVAWCGLTIAFCMSVADVEPVFGPTDTDRWLWAQAWCSCDYWRADEITEPCTGALIVMTRDGGGHVTLMEAYDDGSFLKDGYYQGRGGNQGDMVNVSKQAKSSVLALMWPKGFPKPISTPSERGVVGMGDEGPDVVKVQESLLIPADGDFGQITHNAVEAFQKAHGLEADGVVGPKTWDALDKLNKNMRQGDDGISTGLAAQIDKLVDADSRVQNLSWADRGKPPKGYYNGMAKTFALAVMRHNGDAIGGTLMAEKASTDTEHDALAYYAPEFKAKGMKNDKSGVDTLRHLFVMMVGLGMRESSGNPWEGRDMTATNVESDTCEAGLFQTSWNISNFADDECEGIMLEYEDDPNGFQPTFAKNIDPNASNLDLYGSGDGAKYQWLAKQCPAFAALITAIGMRKGRKHWGPIGRNEVELKSEIDDLLQAVQTLTEDGGVA